MIEFLQKIEKRGIKIDLVDSILITKSINLQLFTFILHGVWSIVIETNFQSQSIYREGYEIL